MSAKSQDPGSLIFPLAENDPLSRENILAALSHTPVIHSFMGTRVVRVRKDTLVKYGPTPHISEANNLRYVRQNSQIHAPDVLDAWTSPKHVKQVEPHDFDLVDGLRTYIVMTYIEGDLLANLWPSMNDIERQSIVATVAKELDVLQTLSIENPGPIGGGAISHGWYFTHFGAGPFGSKEDLEDWFDNRLEVCKACKRVPQDRPPFRFNDLVMCHLDVHPHNIIIDRQGRPCLIDWAFAGGYPPFLEKAAAPYSRSLDERNEFQFRLSKTFQPSMYASEIERLEEMHYAFTTGAGSFRGDLDHR